MAFFSAFDDALSFVNDQDGGGVGDSGSDRWGWTGARETTDGLLRLDVRELARAGALVPEATKRARRPPPDPARRGGAAPEPDPDGR